MAETTPVPRGKIRGNNEVVRKKEQAVLNPNAREWEPKKDKAPMQDRCLFLTFSDGSPLSHRQIYGFFTRKYGRCVEKVYIQTQDRRDKPALFGKVLFDRSAIVAVVMGGQTQVKFMVDKKPLWCKKYQVVNENITTHQYFY